MRVICADSDESGLQNTVGLCESHPAINEVNGFADASETLAWFKSNHADLALLSVELPGMNGLALAAELRKLQPSLSIVFLAEDARFALDAYSVRPQNYLLKPINKNTLEKEIDHYIFTRSMRDISHIEVSTFGNFEITVDGTAVAFKRAKAKELLALLVDRQGAGISRAQAFTDMWEDREFDRRAQKYFDNILLSLKATLKEYGISEIMEVKGGLMRIRPELLNCDRYRFDAGDSVMVEAYQGVYMYGYSWANWNGAFFGSPNY